MMLRSVLLVRGITLGAPVVVQIMALLYSRSNLSDVLPPAANVTISNVPGPRRTLYAAGAELLNIYPVSIAVHGLALNITVQSYRDQLDFGLIAGANIIPDLQGMAAGIPHELDVLEAAFGLGGAAPAVPAVDPAPAPARGRREQVGYYREHVLPWVGQHLRGRSSGDGVSPKHPDWVSVSPQTGRCGAVELG